MKDSLREQRPTLRQFPAAFLRAPALYPAALSYACAVLVIVSIRAGWVKAPYGVITLAFTTVLIVLLSMRHEVLVAQASMKREVHTVHELVNSKYTRLEARIDQLVAALIQNNVDVPDDPEKPKTNHAEDADKHE